MEKEKEDKIISIDLEENDDDGSSDDGDDNNDGNDDDNDGDGHGDLNHFNSDNSNLPSGINSGSLDGQKTKKITRAVKEILTNNNTKFMSNFYPELSNREKRKLSRKINSEGKKIGSVCDENGVASSVEKDVCDCLVEDCPGCHFPCPKCRSYKCGIECRVNRKWVYEIVENEAEVTIPKNTDNSIN